jgi:parvulin-like peptidyl-prolyl isomerase
MKKFVVVPFVVILFAVWVIQLHAEIVDKIVAVVNSEIITLSELNMQADPYQDRIEKSYTGKDKKRLIEETRKTILNRMIDQILVKQEAKRLGIIIKDDEINSMITEMLKKRNFTMDEFKTMLAKDGLSLESYKEEAKEHLMRGRIANREVRSKIIVTEQEIGEYYKLHRQEYEGSVAVKLRQILILCPSSAPAEKKREVRSEMEFILARIKSGEKFEDLAAKYSPGLGGELGFVEKGSMLQPVEEVAFSLKVGEMSGIIVSPAGYHIIQILDKRGAGIKTFESVRAEIIEQITREKSEKKFDEWIGELRKRSHVEIRL